MITAVATVNLAQIVVEVRDELGTVETNAVAEEVYQRLTPKERAIVLRHILPNAVRVILNAPPEEPGTSAEAMPQGKPFSAPSGPPKKLNGYFARRVYSPEFGETTLGELTAQMVRQIAAYRMQQADELYGISERYEKLASRMDESGAKHVNDLPVAEVRSILNGHES